MLNPVSKNTHMLLMILAVISLFLLKRPLVKSPYLIFSGYNDVRSHHFRRSLGSNDASAGGSFYDTVRVGDLEVRLKSEMVNRAKSWWCFDPKDFPMGIVLQILWFLCPFWDRFLSFCKRYIRPFLFCRMSKSGGKLMEKSLAEPAVLTFSLNCFQIFWEDLAPPALMRKNTW